MSDPPTGPRGLTASELADLEAIFAEAADADSDTRRSLLASRCIGRPRLQVEVEALLASHDQLGGFLGAPEGEARPEDNEDAEGGNPDRLRIGSLVGPYRLIEQIGEGGMGNVYLAERADGLFSHRVAIKVTRTSVRDGDTARRFRAERQILASLQHPNIVTLLDGGVTAVGEAYLVMEYVAGAAITRHCRTLGLSLEQRLQLIRQVSSAVQFAHQRGIVHRDLKPGNILVSADGVPKVLDFGVAKLLESSTPGDSTLTRAFPGPLTPNYASPEQLRGLPVTTASDVYALGVLTYEVVTGVRPYDTSGKTLDQVLEMVLETEPSRPSAAREPAAPSGDAPAYSRARLKGDLDAVVLKAMSKEADRRYGSAGELADDLERFLTGKPVVAREPSMGYMLRRVAGRHKAVVTFAAAAVLTIIAALGVAVWQRQVAVRAQARAERRFNETRQLANTLVFKIHDAVAPLAGSTPVRRTIVNEALAYLERLEAESGGDESLQLELSRAYRQIGFIQGNIGSANLGNRSEALKQFEKARRLGLPLALKSGATPGAISNLASVDLVMVPLVKATAGVEAAAVLGREAVAQAEAVVRLGGETPETRGLLGRALFALALVYHSSLESVPHWQRAKDHYEHDLTARPESEEHQRNVALVCKYLGAVYEAAGDDPAALALQRRALELDERRYAANPTSRQTQFDLATSLSTVGTMIERAGKLEEAASLYSRSLEIRRRLSDSDPEDMLSRARTGYMQMRLALLELSRRRPAVARELAKAAIALQETVVLATKEKTNRRELAASQYALGGAERDLGNVARACQLFRQSDTAFQSTSPSTYLRETGVSVQQALARCQGASVAVSRAR
jgi:eukaryotic-like serine/threonine-protein kinase